MAILSFTAADALQTVTVEAGTYLCRISKIEGPKASSSGKSNSFYATVQIIQDGKYKNKEAEVVFNTGTKSPSLLGDRKYFPAASLLEVDAAINKGKVEVADKQLDTDSLVDKPLATIWGVSTVEGKLVNEILGFLPAGAEKDTPGF